MLRSSRFSLALGKKSKVLVQVEKEFGANNYAPLPVVFAKAKGCVVTDPDGKQYLDFLSGYGAVSQGHVHPKLIKVLVDQASRCTLSSRAFYNDRLGDFAKYITHYFGYEKVLPMNTGAEGVETALKLARKWGYKVKGIPKNKAIIGCATNNFHGRTFGCIALSTDPDSFANYGPNLPGIVKSRYGDIKSLENMFKRYGKTMCGFICEPIQGEAGIIIPPKGYLQKVRSLCTKYRVLYLNDEVQSGCGRTGKLLAVDHENVRPDVTILAKALGGGVLPVAAVLADAKFMDVIEPGTHGSTFGGNPLAAAIGLEALRILKSEKMVENSAKQGKFLLKKLTEMKKEFPFIKDVRGRGLFCAVEMKHNFHGGRGGYAFMHAMKNQHILSKVTHRHTCRLTPPLIITDKQMKLAVEKIHAALKQIDADAKALKAHAAASKKTTKK